ARFWARFRAVSGETLRSRTAPRLPKTVPIGGFLSSWMTAATLMIPGLDEIVRGNDPKRRADAARRIADLFLQGASHFRTEHVDLFDGVLVSLVPDTEILARADLAERLSQLANAPRALVGQLDDLSEPHLKELLAGSIDVIRRRLFDVVKPERQAAIKQAMSEIESVMAPVANRRNFEPAQRVILALREAGGLTETTLLGFA